MKKLIFGITVTVFYGVSTKTFAAGNFYRRLVVERALQYILEDPTADSNFRNYVEKKIQYLYEGSVYPDSAYVPTRPDSCMYSESLHWSDFIGDVIRYVKKNYDSSGKASYGGDAAYLMGIMTHDDTDDVYHDNGLLNFVKKEKNISYDEAHELEYQMDKYLNHVFQDQMTNNKKLWIDKERIPTFTDSSGFYLIRTGLSGTDFFENNIKKFHSYADITEPLIRCASDTSSLWTLAEINPFTSNSSPTKLNPFTHSYGVLATAKMMVETWKNYWYKYDKVPLQLVGDVTGDGKADIVNFFHDKVEVWKSVGSAFVYDGEWSTAPTTTHGGWSTRDNPRMLADVNGDGKMDIVAIGTKATFVYESTGSSFKSAWSANAFSSNTGWGSTKYLVLAGDVDGDGKDDLVGFGKKTLDVYLSTGTGFSYSSTWGLKDSDQQFTYEKGWRNFYHTRALADINGDGKADIVGFAASKIMRYVTSPDRDGWQYLEFDKQSPSKYKYSYEPNRQFPLKKGLKLMVGNVRSDSDGSKKAELVTFNFSNIGVSDFGESTSSDGKLRQVVNSATWAKLDFTRRDGSTSPGELNPIDPQHLGWLDDR
ncbi:MAG: VCBS repeat-containing protein, partial [Oligoflexales bacterium]|nr:VCBS repeat-containing protein [Oligoflexales bacterium]